MLHFFFFALKKKTQNQKKKNRFSITTQKNEWVFGSASSKEREIWLNELNKILKQFVKCYIFNFLRFFWFFLFFSVETFLFLVVRFRVFLSFFWNCEFAIYFCVALPFLPTYQTTKQKLSDKTKKNSVNTLQELMNSAKADTKEGNLLVFFAEKAKKTHRHAGHKKNKNKNNKTSKVNYK